MTLLLIIKNYDNFLFFESINAPKPPATNIIPNGINALTSKLEPVFNNFKFIIV